MQNSLGIDEEMFKKLNVATGFDGAQQVLKNVDVDKIFDQTKDAVKFVSDNAHYFKKAQEGMKGLFDFL